MVKKYFAMMCMCLFVSTANSEQAIDWEGMIKQQNDIQNKYFGLCEETALQEYPKLLPNDKTKLCVCFSEKMAAFIYSGDESEFSRYQALDTYKVKIWNRELEKCHKELKL